MNDYDEYVKCVKEFNRTHIKRMNSVLTEYSDFKNIKDKVTMMLDAPALNGAYGPKTKNVIVAFDTETTNAINDDDKRPFIYSFALTIMDINTGDNVNIHCSTMNEFVRLIKRLCKMAKCFVSNNIKPRKDMRPVSNGTDDHNNYDDSNDVYLNIYVHNLPFDFSFLLKSFKLRTLFCSAPHKPYYALTWDGAKFIDTVVLTQKTLEQLGKGLTQFDIKKQVGDLDYNKIRTPDTTFSSKERGYIVSDTMVLAAYMCELCREDYNYCLYKVPLTQTGKVRNYLSRLCQGKADKIIELVNSGFNLGDKKTAKELKDAVKIVNNHYSLNEERKKAYQKINSYGKKSKKQYKKMIERLMINNVRDYDEMKDVYAGGYTHANAKHTGKIEEDVGSFDFTSSYPAVICSEKFPMYMYRHVKYSKHDFILKLNNAEKDDKCYFFDAHFRDIKRKPKIYDTFLSVSKVFCDIGGEIKNVSRLTNIERALVENEQDNGRLVRIKECIAPLTSVDWETLIKVYDFDDVEFSNIMEFDMDYLPKQIIMAVLHFYEQKTKLKHIKGKEHDYMLNKEQLNSIYGMMVQDPVHPEIEYHGRKQNWDVSLPLGKIPELDNYNRSKSRFLWYPWGVMVTAYARRNLWTGIIACGKDYIYSDTDSIKILNKKNHLKYINEYNNQIKEKIARVCVNYNIPIEKANPVDVNGNHHQLGIWDADDGFYSYFKTLGAKRYIDISKDNNEFECTIAGLPKKKGAAWMIEKSGINHNGFKIESDNIKELFDVFNDNMTIPPEDSGKLGHTYVDRYGAFEITDYQGHKTLIPKGMGCYLAPIGFTLSLSESYVHFVELQDNISELRDIGFCN